MKSNFSRALALLMSLVVSFSCASVAFAADCKHENTTITTVKEPTCQEEGVSKEVCKDCGLSKTVPIDKSNHIYTLIKTPATCTKGGYITYDCKNCDDIQQFSEADPLGHAWNNWVTDKESTCTEDGLKHRICSRCEEKQEETLQSTGHRYTDSEVIKEATCTEKGLLKYTCTVCKKDIEEATDALEHVTVVYPEVKATCTTDGKTEGKYCSRCKTMYVPQETVKAKGHDEEITPEIPATCNEKGMSEGRVCKTCGEVTKKRTEIPAKGHNPVIIPGIEPTCISKGLSEGKKCANCGVVYTEQIELPISGHVIVIDKALPATCTKTGLTEGSHCSACKTVLAEQQTVPATGHSPVYYDVISPTCDEVGRKAGSKCSVCGEVLSGLELVPPLGHQEEVYPAKEATCTTTGLSEGRTCIVCGMVTKEQVIIPAKGHDDVAVLAVAASCQRTGLTEGRRCITCDTVIVEQQIVPKTDHKYVTTPAIAATCTTAGRTAGKECEICSLVASVPTATLPLGHSTKEELTKKASFTSDGTTESSCERCGLKLSTAKISSVKTIKLSATKYTYNGKVKTPTVTVTDSSGKKLTQGKDYKLTYSKGRTEPGTYKVKVTLMGNYSGSKKVSFTIIPAKTTVKATQTTSSITLSWSAVHGAYGYRVYQYNTKTSKWTTLIKATKATKYTFKSLDDGATYIYSVKPYARVDGKVIWGSATRITTVTKPLAPSISSAESLSSGSATIKWKRVTGASGYIVYYSMSKNGSYKKWTTTEDLSYVKTKLAKGNTYFIKVKAYTTTDAGKVYSSASNARAVYIK